MSGMAQNTVYALRRDGRGEVQPPAAEVLRLADPRRDPEPRRQRPRQHRQHAAAEPHAVDHLGADGDRHHHHDADDQLAADHRGGADAAAERDGRRQDREAVAGLLRAPAEGARRAERARRRDVCGPHHRHGVRPRGAVGRDVRRPQREVLRRRLAGAVRHRHDVSDHDVHRQPRLRGGGGDRRLPRDAAGDRARRRAGVHPVQPPVLDADHAVEQHRQHHPADDRVGRARVRAARRARRARGRSRRRPRCRRRAATCSSIASPSATRPTRR